MDTPKPKHDVMHETAVLIIRYRFVIMLLFIAAAVFCGLSLGKVKVSSELTIFLSEKTETRRGLHIMEDSFITYASEDVMVANVTAETAQELADAIADFDGVSSVTFDRTAAHYADASARLVDHDSA